MPKMGVQMKTALGDSSPSDYWRGDAVSSGVFSRVSSRVSFFFPPLVEKKSGSERKKRKESGNSTPWEVAVCGLSVSRAGIN